MLDKESNTFCINGNQIKIDGKNISIINGVILVDGMELAFPENEDSNKGKNILEIYVHGDVQSVTSDRSITVKGNVGGSVIAQGTVTCGEVGDFVEAGGSVYCDDVRGNVEAGGSVTCDDVAGDVHSEGTAIIDN